MIEALFTLGLRQQRLITIIVIAITIPMFWGVTRLEIDTSFNSLIPADEPAKLAYQRAMDQFGSDNKTIIYIRDKQLWTAEKLTRLDGLVRALKDTKHVYRVNSLFNLRIIEGKRDQNNKPQISSKLVLDGVPADDIEAEQARLRAGSNPLYTGNLFSEDGTVTAIIVTVQDLENSEDFSIDVYNKLETMIGPQRAHFEQIFQVGPPRINAELQQSLTADFKLLGPLSAIVLVGSILFFMRSMLAAMIPLITSALAIIWTFGVMGWLGIPINVLSVMIPSLIIVIGSTEDTHMMSAFFGGLSEQTENQGSVTVAQKNQAIRYMAKHTGLPMLLTVLTTFLGFASNLFGNIVLIQHFAIASTFAIFFNGVITILVVPVMLAKFGKSIGRGAGSSEIYGNNLPDQVIRVFRITQDRFPNVVLSITLVLCVFFTYHASHLYVTNDPLSYFPDDKPLIQEAQTIHEDLAGIKVFFIALEAENDKAFLEPENLRKINKIQNFLAKQAVFDTTLSVVDHLKYVNSQFQGEFSANKIPPTRQLVAQYLMFFHRSELESYISHDYRRANIVVRHNISDSHTLNDYIDELKDFANNISGDRITARVVGQNLLVNRAAEELMISQIKALVLLLALIFVLM
ncbi:MAG: MMPL family transporter, partial [Gammaproteobacteria bacterium]|nr:MMPL family transporter [Gammaproteobacteria bacterium]